MIGRFKSWRNVPVVEKKSKMRRKLGRWRVNQIRKGKERNLPLVFMIAVARLSEKFLIRRKFN